MDRDQFDRLSRLVAAAGTRRAALRLLVAGAFAGAAGGAATTDARKHRGRGQDRQEKRVTGQQAELCTNLCIRCDGKPIGPGTNLAKCDFDDESFLDGLDLSSANVAKACFARAELRAARFNGAGAGGACFADADLRGASFRGASVLKAVFCGADLRGADFRGSNVKPSQLACATVGCDTILPTGKPAVPCQANQTCCGGVCLNTRTDPQNCGACGNTCPTTKADACTAGECTCGNGPACLQSTTCCAGNCVDTQTSTANCGGCGQACDPERADNCAFGECRCGDDFECPPFQACFNFECGSG